MPEPQRVENARVLDYCKLSPQSGGVAIAISVPDVINGTLARSRSVDQLWDLLNRGISVAIRPSGLTTGDAGELGEFCSSLGEGIRGAGIAGAVLEFTIDAAEVAPDAAMFYARRHLGAGTVNILVDREAFTRWRSWFWRTRIDPHRRIAFWPLVQSACPLLATEAAGDVLPASALQVPAQTAWVLATLSLDRYATPTGDVDVDGLEMHLQAVLATAEQAHDSARWPTPGMQQDAWLNRRVAIRLDGIGDLVAALGLEPCSHRTLDRLDRLLAHCRSVVLRHSRELAATSETLPAITACSPSRIGGIAWEQCWMQAVRQSATRHRNLIALSPYALFPRTAPDFRYANLLPLLVHADACAIDGSPAFRNWNIDRFTAFHTRLGAILARLCTGYVVAEQR